ncbi:MAG: nuclear transport factor 2 family protein [Micromonosporaceae bacterium]|nr:nuclear transport factor 2 family protein [Micromonosporaceae bacterium]
MTDMRIAILGLGRMGSAMARRLRGEGWDVVGWHRSGAPIDGVTVEADLAKAVASAQVAVLCLFDDAACTEVLAQVRDARSDGLRVVNTSTTSPAAAARFASEVGPAYVHAPVIGSVPAVAAGTLQILAGGDPAAIEAVTPVLTALGTIVHVGQADTAAAVKLVANGVLAGVVATMRDALRQADALGLDRALVLDVLERGPIGGLVKAKRDRIVGSAAERPADFAVDGLAKDQGLLAAASGQPWPHARDIEAALEQGTVRPDDDFAALVTAPVVDDGVRAPLEAYIRGHATGDPSHFLDAFLPTAHIEGLRDGAFVSWTLDEYMTLFPGHPADDEAERSRRIDSIVVAGTIASATMTLRHGVNTFTDMFILVRTEAGWRIANKVYHRH